MFRDKLFRSSTFINIFVLFIGLHVYLYFFIFFFHTSVPFDGIAYTYNSHHYVHDARVDGGEFSFLRALGVWDAQWYLRIADAGYPSREVFDAQHDPRFMGALTYAFFPLYPMLIATINLLFANVELSAFMLANLLLLANFISLYYVVTKLFSQDIAIRTILLLFIFPFSIFFRSYYTEGIFMLLIIWMSYFAIKNKFFYATLVSSLLFIARPNGLAAGLIFFVTLYKAWRKKSLSWHKTALYLALSTVPFMAWLFYCYVQTDNPLYWHYIQSVWYKGESILSPLNNNLERVLSFFSLQFHTAHESKIDTGMMVGVLAILIASKKFFKKYPQLWWLSFIIWVFPILVKDTMSFARFQSVSFPLFIFLAARVTGWKFYVLCGIFLTLLLATSLNFVNWRWIG